MLVLLLPSSRTWQWLPLPTKWPNGYILSHLPPFRRLHLQLKQSSFSNNQLKSCILSAAFSYSSRLQEPHPFLFPCCISFILSLVILISLLCLRIHWGHVPSPTPDAGPNRGRNCVLCLFILRGHPKAGLRVGD